MEFDPSTAEPVTAVVEAGFDPESAKPVQTGEKVNEKYRNQFTIPEDEFKAASPIGRLKMLLSHPWDKYVASVDQGFKGIDIPRVEAEQGTGFVNRAGQVGAALDNTVTGAAGGIVSPGGAAAIVSPGTVLYAAPRFVAGGIEHIVDAVKGAVSGEDNLQTTAEKAAGGALMLAGGAHGIKSGLKSSLAPKTPEQAIDLVKQEAANTTDPNAKAALEAAAVKISDSAEKGVAFDPESATPVAGPETTRLSSTADGAKKLEDIQTALKSPDTVIQYSVWDKEMLPPGADRTAQVDLINPKDTQSLGGIASTNRSLLQELGVDAPPAPDSLPPGRYTLDQIKEAIAKEADANSGVKTSEELIAEIKKNNPNADLEAPAQLLGDKKYKVVDVPVSEIGPVFGAKTVQGDVVAKYMAEPSADPIVLARVDGVLRPVDGKHRLTAARNTGEETIRAYVPVDDPVVQKSAPQAQETAPVGLGAASPKEFQPVRESATSLKNAAVDAERKARGAPPLMEVAKKGFGEVWDQAMKAIDENQNVADDLISTVKEKPRATTDVEQAILLHREIDLKNQLDKVTKNLAESIGTEDSLASDRLNRARILDELSDLEDVSRSAGTETSRGLNARKLIAKEDLSLAKMLTDRRAEKGGAQLTDAEIAEVEKQHADIEEAQRALDQHEAQQELADAITTPEEATAQIDKLEKEVKAEDAKPKPAPKSKEEAALKQLKTRTRNQIDELKKKIANGDFSKKAAREPVKLDEEALRLKAELQRTKDRFQETLLRDRIAQRSAFERAQDTFVKWRRGFLLSSPVTLAKLTSAAVQRMVFTPLEELAGAGIGKLIPKIESRAPREGGLNVNAEARAITEGITKGMSDAAELLRTGKTNLEVLFGKGREGGVKESDVTPRSIIDLFGQIHGALKAPVKRAEFARSLEKRMAYGIRNGIDVTDPAIQTKLMVQAYKDANRSIFLQDNIVVNAYNRALGALLEKQKSTGEPSTAGKILATTAKTLLPIVRVPTNIVAETIQVATGTLTGSYRLARTFGRAAKNISPEEADLILRDLKKGSLGAALLAVGYFNAKNIGGYYQSGQKRSDKDVGYGSLKIDGVNIPSYLLHNPLIEALQIGATIRRVADSKFLKKDKDTQGIAAGTLAAALGLIEEVPFVRQQVETAKMLDSREGPYARGEFVKSLVVPSAVDFVARQTDKDAKGNLIQRKPSTVLQHVETGIPGLRQTVPARSGTKQMGQPPPMLKK